MRWIVIQSRNRKNRRKQKTAGNPMCVRAVVVLILRVNASVRVYPFRTLGIFARQVAQSQ